MKLRKPIKYFILILLVLSISTAAAYTFIFSKNAYRISEVTYKSNSLPSQFNGFRIAYISDIHLKEENDISRLDEIVTRLNKEHFQMVLFGGDLYEDKVFNDTKVTAILKKIHSSYGRFAVLGDEDAAYNSEVSQILNEAGFEVLSDQMRTIHYMQKTIRLAGYSTSATSSLKSSNDFTIGLSHYPDLFKETSSSENLHLSGHSGGGYVYIPLVGALTKVSHAETYNHGKYVDNATLYVSNGLSVTSKHSYKFLAANEILMIALKNA